MEWVRLQIDPVPKPRMTQRDKWKKRDCVERYRAFCDELRILIGKVHASGDYPDLERVDLVFVVPMPKSWSSTKKVDKFWRQHDSRPDRDNFLKAWQDALFQDDCRIWDGRVTKIWGVRGEICFRTSPVSLPEKQA